MPHWQPSASALQAEAPSVQVFDLSEHRPDQVLEAIWKNFSKHESSQPERVKALRDSLHIIVAGGDGTVGWTLQAWLRPVGHVLEFCIVQCTSKGAVCFA